MFGYGGSVGLDSMFWSFFLYTSFLLENKNMFILRERFRANNAPCRLQITEHWLALSKDGLTYNGLTDVQTVAWQPVEQGGDVLCPGVPLPAALADQAPRPALLPPLSSNYHHHHQHHHHHHHHPPLSNSHWINASVNLSPCSMIHPFHFVKLCSYFPTSNAHASVARRAPAAK